MTMLAFATHPDRAEVLTDTCGYTLSSRHITFGHRKATPIPGHCAVITSIGSTFYAETLRQVLNRVASGFETFDELVDHAADIAPDVWNHVEGLVLDAGRTRGLSATDVYLIGYSDQRTRFRAVCLSSRLGFEPVDVDGAHVRPTPLDRRPSDLEVPMLERSIAERAWPEAREQSFAVLGQLLECDDGPTPSSVDHWVALARQIRHDRAVTAPLLTGFCVYVAGDAELTTITTEGVATEVIHRYDDTGDEWGQMVALSLHPDSQLAPCMCSSGLRYVDCCLAIEPDEACPCGSGDTFADCCRVTGPDDVARQQWINDQGANVLELCAEMAAGFLAATAVVPSSV